MKVSVQVHVLAREVLFHHGVVAFGVFSANQQMTPFDHAPAVLLKPHSFASLQTVEFTAGLLFGFTLSGSLELSLGFCQGLNGP